MLRYSRAIRKLSTPFVMGILVLLAILLSACQSDNPSLLDQPAPDFTLPGIDGEEITLSDYEGRQPVLLFFHMAMG
jgi:cytochrome oxidase Cu insertion factor (SCO1/SenC/PrrC family)